MTVIASSRIAHQNQVHSTIFLIQGILVDAFEPLSRFEIKSGSPGWKTATWWITNVELSDNLNTHIRNNDSVSNIRFYRSQPQMAILEFTAKDCNIIKVASLEDDYSIKLSHNGSTMSYTGKTMTFELQTDDVCYHGQEHGSHMYRQSNNYLVGSMQL